MPQREAIVPTSNGQRNWRECLEGALDGLYRAKNALRENRPAREEFESRVDTLIDDVERELEPQKRGAFETAT
jgi:hypothetical protein